MNIVVCSDLIELWTWNEDELVWLITISPPIIPN